MDRVHRQELKHDKFVEQVGHTVEYAAEHKGQVVRYGAIALAVVLIAAGVYGYMRYQAGKRQEALRHAVRVQEAQISPQEQPFQVTFKTEAEKRQAAQKAWTELANNFSGSAEASIAHYYMGINAVDQGNAGEAEKHLKQVVDSGDEPYVSQAKLSLAQIYHSNGRTADAEKLLRSVISDPTILVSKEQATIALAGILAKSNPTEARKLLEPLRTERGPVSRAAITMLSEIPAAR